MGLTFSRLQSADSLCTGTSIFCNYLDYRFKNNTDSIYQIVTYTTNKYICGEIRTDKALTQKIHIKAENEKFVREDDVVYREGDVFCETIDVRTGNHTAKVLIRKNHARVLCDTAGLTI